MATGKPGAALRPLQTVFHLGALGALNDGQLLERFLTAPPAAAELAFAALVDRHGPMVLRACRALLGDTNDAEDAFQATFLVLVRKARGLWVRESLGPWLHQVAHRTARAARRAASRRRRFERAAAAEPRESRPNADQELRRVLHEEIERLPGPFRAPIVLCDLEGATHEQAARRLGWPIGTVKSRAARGREKLRDRLTRRGFAPQAGLAVASLRLEAPGAAVSRQLTGATAALATRFLTQRAALLGPAALLTRGALRTMAIVQAIKVGSVALALGAVTSGAVLFAGPGAQGPAAPGATTAGAPTPKADDPTAVAVRRGRMNVELTQRGVLEAASSPPVTNPFPEAARVKSILPEGSRVKKGELVCVLTTGRELGDPTQRARLAEKVFREARHVREVAELALNEYEEGIYKQEHEAAAAAVGLAKSAITRAEARLERTRRAKKSLETSVSNILPTKPTDMVAALDVDDRLDAAEQVLLVETAALEQAQTRRQVLQRFTKPRMERMLRREIEQAAAAESEKETAWKAAVSFAEAGDLLAPADGLVVYGDDPFVAAGDFAGKTAREREAAARARGMSVGIREGARLNKGQWVFRIATPGAPLVLAAEVPVAQAEALKPGQKARIAIDAFLEKFWEGTVEAVETEVYSSAVSRNVYGSVRRAVVKFDQPPPGAHAGFSAQVTILTGAIDDVISVPTSAVVTMNGVKHVVVKAPNGLPEWRVVTIGALGAGSVQVKQGLEAGDLLITNPLNWMSEEDRKSLPDLQDGPKLPNLDTPPPQVPMSVK